MEILAPEMYISAPKMYILAPKMYILIGDRHCLAYRNIIYKSDIWIFDLPVTKC